MQQHVHARLDAKDRSRLEIVKKATGASESELIRQGLSLVYEQTQQKHLSALDLAGDSVGKFKSRHKDLSTNKKHLRGLGK